MRSAYVVIATILLATPVLADDTPPAAPPAPPAVVAVIQQQDLTDLQRILTDQIPQRWGQPMVEWVNRLIARQKDEAAKAPTSAVVK
jgi:hypothetical protein